MIQQLLKQKRDVLSFISHCGFIDIGQISNNTGLQEDKIINIITELHDDGYLIDKGYEISPEKLGVDEKYHFEIKVSKNAYEVAKELNLIDNIIHISLRLGQYPVIGELFVKDVKELLLLKERICSIDGIEMINFDYVYEEFSHSLLI